MINESIIDELISSLAIKKISFEESNEFLNIKKKYSNLQSLAISLFIICPVPLLSLLFLCEKGNISDKAAVSVGVIILLFIVAIGV